MAYRAEIEIAVKGAKRLEAFNKDLVEASKAIDEINSALVSVSQGTVASFSNLSSSLREAQQQFNNAARGTDAYGTSLNNLLQAERVYNEELRERNRLLNNAKAAQQAAGRTVTPGLTGFSALEYTPALPKGTIRSNTVQQSWNKFFSEAEEVAKELQTTATTRQSAVKQSWNRFFSEAEEVAKELQTTATARQSKVQQSWNRFFSDAAKTAKELQTTAVTRQSVIKKSWTRFFIEAAQTADELKDITTTRENKIKQSWNKFFAQAEELATDLAQNTARTRSKQGRARLGQAAGGALISGAFPLLTGGGGLESGLGAAGGALGALFGPGGAFAGGIAGSALGRILQDSDDLNKSLATLNARLGAVGTSAVFTTERIDSLAKQLSVTKEEAIQLAAEFNAVAEAQAIPEVAKAFGPVGGVATFELIATAAENEKSAAQAIDALRGQIGVKTAEQLKDVLKIEGSQAAAALLLDAVLNKSVDIRKETAETVTNWDRINFFLQEYILGIAQTSSPAGIAAKRAQAVGGVDEATIKKQLENFRRLRQGIRDIQEEFDAKNKKQRGAGAKAPESQELRFQQQIRQELIKQFDIETKTKQLSVSRLNGLRIEADRIEMKQVKQLELLELQRKQALTQSKFAGDAAIINKLYDERAETIKKQNAYTLEQNKIQQDSLRIERERQDLRNIAGLERTKLQLSQQLQTAQSFGLSEGEKLALTQENRRVTEMQRLNTLIEEQKVLQGSLDKTVSKRATRKIAALQVEKQLYEELLPQIAAAERQQLLYNQALGYAQPAINNLFTGLQQVVAGTKSAEEAFADFLNTIANQLIQTAAQMIAQYIALGIARTFAFGGTPSGGGGGLAAFTGGFTSDTSAYSAMGLSAFSNIPFMAKGGPVSGGTPYMVGERGPELFVPRSSGTIVPNNALGGGSSNVVVNVDATGSKVSGDNDQASQLGRVIGAAVQAELVKQKRPGGLLAQT